MRYTQEQLYDELAPLVESQNLVLVDCVFGTTAQGSQVALVVYSDEGIGTDECAAVHRLSLPRLEVLLDSRDIQLEVSSPGLERKIRHLREYQIFQGKKLKLMKKNGDWLSGKILKADSKNLTVNTANGDLELALSDIQKAQLEYSWEGK